LVTIDLNVILIYVSLTKYLIVGVRMPDLVIEKPLAITQIKVSLSGDQLSSIGPV